VVQNMKHARRLSLHLPEFKSFGYHCNPINC
jgi:hypothetical protein